MLRMIWFALLTSGTAIWYVLQQGVGSPILLPVAGGCALASFILPMFMAQASRRGFPKPHEPEFMERFRGLYSTLYIIRFALSESALIMAVFALQDGSDLNAKAPALIGYVALMALHFPREEAVQTLYKKLQP